MDHIINKIAKMTISPFFVENIQQIQLSAIRCATIIFSKYPHHRQNLVIDILNSLARLPTSKRNLRNYRLSHLMDDEDDEIPCIQMLSALVLQLVQERLQIRVCEFPKIAKYRLFCMFDFFSKKREKNFSRIEVSCKNSVSNRV